MIVFDLTCTQSHVFEGWFRDSAAFEEQKAAGGITCPVCGDSTIAKAPMAPRLATRGHDVRHDVHNDRAPFGHVMKPAAGEQAAEREVFHAPAAAPDSKAAALAKEAARALRALHDEVARSCDYVGDKFSEEARKMHYGEAAKRGIYGEATADEANELRDEGIEVQPLPRLPRENA